MRRRLLQFFFLTVCFASLGLFIGGPYVQSCIIGLAIALAQPSPKKFADDAKFVAVRGRYQYHVLNTTYEDYVALQTQGNKRKLYWQNVQSGEVRVISDWLTKHVKFRHKFGLCHGVRQGNEQRWFQEALGWEVGSIIGTDISDTATWFANTIQFDFHDVKEEWINHTDFIYSNALDHSYNPELALTQWLSCVHDDGVVIVQYYPEPDGGRKWLNPIHGDFNDVSLQSYRQMVQSIGATVVHELNIGTPPHSNESIVYLILARKKRRKKKKASL